VPELAGHHLGAADHGAQHRLLDEHLDPPVSLAEQPKPVAARHDRLLHVVGQLSPCGDGPQHRPRVVRGLHPPRDQPRRVRPEQPGARPADLDRARAAVTAWRDQNPAGTSEELIAAVGWQARIPHASGEMVTIRYTLHELLDRLCELIAEQHGEPGRRPSDDSPAT